ncbi:MAG: aminotransferase class I/II-fold pyridoxal phosphate-dependent enzyme [Acidobacteriota bacterium]|nr:aminotransferase class I/II-fold pyridoxal phosphate-dependent enzyme [Acidobacteriota bacterium]
MSERLWLNRRAFLRGAGITALAGAANSGPSLVTPVRADSLDQAGSTNYDFDTVYDRVGQNSVKWDAAIARYGRENIDVGMGIADMDFQAPPCITRALAERCKHENWGYMSTPRSFYQQIADWDMRRNGLEVDPESITLSDGVHPALIAALKAVSPAGSKVLLTTAVYSGFYMDLRQSRTLEENSPMIEENGRYRIDFDDFESRMSHDTDALILCNPQNPTGNCWSEEDLLRLGRMCLEHRVVVLSDEIHCDFVMKGQKYTPFASLPDKEVVDNSITFKAASKSFSLAAMKIAWFFSTNPELLALVRAQHRANTNTLGVVANQGALTDEGADWLDQVNAYIDANHDFTEQYIRENMPGVKYTKAQGTYLAWLDVGGVAERLGAKRLAEEATANSETGRPVTAEAIVGNWFIDNAKVQLNAGSSYGPGGENHMRMNVATSRQTLKLALDNMAAALNDM